MKKFKFFLCTVFISLLIIPATVANAASAYVTIGGTEFQLNSSPIYLLTDADGNITSENASAENYNISVDSFAGANITLNNATIKAADTHAIYSNTSIKLNGIGKNVIISDSTQNSDAYYGIYSAGAVTVNGDIEEISAYGDAIYARSGIAVSGNINKISSKRNGLYSNSGAITVSGTIKEILSGDTGIDANSGAVTVSGSIGKIVNEVTYVKSIGEKACGIHSHYNDITISGSVGDITVNVKYGITHSTTAYGLWSYAEDIIVTGSIGNITVRFDDTINPSHVRAAAGMLAKNITIKGSVGDMNCEICAMTVNGKIYIDGNVGNINCSVIDDSDTESYCAAIHSNGGLYKDSNGIYISGSVGNINIGIKGAYSDFDVRAIYTTTIEISGTIGDITSECYGILARTLTVTKTGTIGNISGKTNSIYTWSGSTDVYGKIGDMNSVRSGSFTIQENAETGNITGGLYCSGSAAIAGKTGNLERLTAFSVTIYDNAEVGTITGGITSERSVGLHGTTGNIGKIYCAGTLTVSGNIGTIYGNPAIQAYGGIVLRNRTIIASPANGVIAIRDPNKYNMLWYTVMVGSNCATSVTFGKLPYSLTVTNGSGSGKYAAGAEVTISANTKHCIEFREWDLSPTIVFKEGNKNTPEAIIIMPDIDTHISATFNPIDEKLHNLTVINKKDATCHEDGHRQYYKCSCGSIFADEYRQTKITDLDTWLKTDGYIKSEGHFFSTNWKTVEHGSNIMNGLEKIECYYCDYIEYRIVYTRLYTFGDVNMDGSVTAADARLALRISVGLDSPTKESRQLADYNEDSTVTASDARLILRLSVGLEEKKLIEEKYAKLPNLKT